MLIRKMWTLGFVLVVVAASAGCGGGGDSSETVSAGAEDQAEATTPAPTPEITPDPTPGDGEAPGDPASGETPDPPSDRYQTAYDANATYTMDDITMRGSYLKINLGDLTPEQLNRVVHRMRSEFCTCGCPKDPVDQCLINDPACGTAVTLANQIIREEKTKG
jgi:hypothetical protein